MRKPRKSLPHSENGVGKRQGVMTRPGLQKLESSRVVFTGFAMQT